MVPRGGLTIDLALLYGLVRVESNFEPYIVSRRGARGLMQIMPVTAGYLLDSPGARPHVAGLDDPATNLDLGQRYVHYLAGHEAIHGDLIRLLATYNIGGNGFVRLKRSIRAGDDPILFIEAIPKVETRGFVQRVLAHSWLYAEAQGLPRPSLDSLAAGEFPILAAERPALLH